jgi:hypothetical protein
MRQGGVLPLGLVALWFMYRIARGWLRLLAGESSAEPSARRDGASGAGVPASGFVTHRAGR